MQYQDIKVTPSKQTKMVKIELEAEDYDYYIRIMGDDFDRVNEFFNKVSNEVLFDECIFDVDQHYNELCIQRHADKVLFIFGATSLDFEDKEEAIEMTEEQGKELLLDVLNGIK